jgi:signal transduction histidine kinase
VPDLDPAIRAGLATGDFMGAPWSSADGRGYQLGLWMDRTDTGRCAVLLLRMPPRPGEFRERVSAIALIVISVIVATWLAAGPVLRRLRKLATDVHRSADTRYDTPVVVEGQDEVADLAQAFNDAGARVRQHLVDLQRREEHLRQFVANTAHDVGVPLTVLQGHLSELDTCKEEVRSNKSEVEVGSDKDEGGSAGAHVRAAIGEAHYLGSLIRNLNAATRLDAVDMPLVRHDVDLNALVERLAARYRVVARARGVELNEAVPETPVIVSAEVTLLEQALGNLVDNAVRHNRPGGHVAIVLDARHGGFSLTVTDDGPGVAEADLARLTERGHDGRTDRDWDSRSRPSR